MNYDVKWMKYQFTPEQINQAATDLAFTRSQLVVRGWAPYGALSRPNHHGDDIVGTIRRVVRAAAPYGTMNSPEVIAETILTHFLGINVYSWEEKTWRDSVSSLAAYDKLESTLDALITWLRSDIFTGGNNGSAGSAAAPEESPYVGAH